MSAVSLLAGVWLAFVADYTDPVHHNHIYNQSLGWYQTKAECEKDLDSLRYRLVVGVVVPKGVITCVKGPEK